MRRTRFGTRGSPPSAPMICRKYAWVGMEWMGEAKFADEVAVVEGRGDVGRGLG